MECAVCKSAETKIAWTKDWHDPDGWSVKIRHRECTNGHVFDTYECYEYADVEAGFRTMDAIRRIRHALNQRRTGQINTILDALEKTISGNKPVV